MYFVSQSSPVSPSPTPTPTTCPEHEPGREGICLKRHILHEKQWTTRINRRLSYSPNSFDLHHYSKAGRFQIFMETNQKFERLLDRYQDCWRQKCHVIEGRSNCFRMSDDGSSGQTYRWLVPKKTKVEKGKRNPRTRDLARRQRFWKQKKSAKTSHLNARQQQTEENTFLEEENSIHTDSE